MDHGRGADLLIDVLVRAGVQTIFGVPGDTGVVLYDALQRRSGDVRHVLARDERHAGYMADAYARSTGTVGVTEASSGGGVTYLVGGLGDAYASSVPILAITSDIRRGSRDTGALTEIDQRALFAAVTKWQGVAEAADDIPRLVREALDAATSGRPAPVVLIVPEDVLEEEGEEAGTADASVPAVELPRERTAAPPDQVTEAARVLETANRPAVVAGSGVHLSGAWPQLARLADHAGLPVATSIHGKGAIAEPSPWSLGVVGANGARPYANDYLAQADAVLFVGTRANATDTNSYASPSRSGVLIVQIDIDPARAGRNYPGAIGLAGDARTVLGQLLDVMAPADPGVAAERRRWIRAQRVAWERAEARPLPLPDRDSLDPREVVRALAELVGGDALVVADPGTPTPNLAAYWECPGGARNVIIPRGHGPMGYAIPAAIGASLAHPGRRILCLTTEGSMAMACGEWETAVRLALPITYVVLDNRSMGWIKMLQHLYEGQRYFGVDVGPVDAAAVAAGMGLPGMHVTSLDELRKAVEQAADLPGPSLAVVTVPDQTQLPPPVAPWQAALESGDTVRPAY